MITLLQLLAGDSAGPSPSRRARHRRSEVGHFQNGHVPRFRRPSVDSGLNKARSVAKRGDRALKFITSRLA